MLDQAAPRSTSGWRALVGLLLLMLVLNIAVRFVQVPIAAVGPVSMLLSAVFFAIPIVGLFVASRGTWTLRASAALIGAGISIQAISILILRSKLPPATEIIVFSVSQIALLAWCAGLGGALSALIKERNLILPVAIFLAGLDAFLVTYPYSWVNRVVNNAPQILQTVGYNLPRVSAEPISTAPVQISATVGPADFFFLFMFFICVHKFNMRERATLIAMVATLLAYLVVVLGFGDLSLGPVSLGALPVLLPMGIVLLALNLDQFKLNTEEKVGTWLFTIIAIGLAWFGINQAGIAKATRAAPVNSVPAQEPQAPQGLPAPTGQGQSP